jgi:hypothetical protein
MEEKSMKRTKTFFFLTALLIAGSITAYAEGGLENVADKAKKANDTVKSVNSVVRDVDETVEGVGGVKGGVKDIGQDTVDVVGIDTTPKPKQTASQTQQGETAGWPTAAMFKDLDISGFRQPAGTKASYTYQQNNSLEIYLTGASAKTLQELKRNTETALKQQMESDDSGYYINGLVYLSLEGNVITLSFYKSEA